MVDLLDLVFYLRCRGCGSRWKVGASIPADIGDQVAELERLLCGTRAPDPGSEAETNG